MKLVQRGKLFARFTLGDFTITSLSDGYADMAVNRLHGASTSDLAPVPLFDGNLRLSVNAYFVKMTSGNLLIDAGSANAWRATTGKLYDALAEANIARESIELVALTHTHVDHVNGLVMPNGQEAFANCAAIFVPEQELSLFQSEERLSPTFPKVVPFKDGDAIAPGVNAVAAHGHEIGHSAFLIESGGERLLIWGDIVHVPSVQFSNPSVTWEFDVDQNQARKSRLLLLDRLANEEMAVAGAHLDFPGIGFVARGGAGYRFNSIV